MRENTRILKEEIRCKTTCLSDLTSKAFKTGLYFVL